MKVYNSEEAAGFVCVCVLRRATVALPLPTTLAVYLAAQVKVKALYIFIPSISCGCCLTCVLLSAVKTVFCCSGWPYCASYFDVRRNSIRLLLPVRPVSWY